MNRVLLLILTVSVAGCANLHSNVNNNPLVNSPSGKKVFLTIQGDKGESINDPVAAMVYDTAKKWLIEHGYSLTTLPREAHNHLSFRLVGYSRVGLFPQYSGVNSTNINTSLQSFNDPSLKRLRFAVRSFSWGQQPQISSEGYIHADALDLDIYQSQTALKKSVQTLLNDSILDNVGNSRHIASDKDPACWPHLGMELNSMGLVRKLASGSKMKSLGIELGDEIVSINGKLVGTNYQEDNYKSGQAVSITFYREGSRQIAQHKVDILCID